MEASPAWVDDVIVIFPQDGNPVSWRLKHWDDEVRLLKSPVEWRGWTMSMTSRQLYPVLLAGVRMETSSEMRKWACWEQNVSDVRLGKMGVLPHDPQPRGHLWGWRQVRVWADDFAGRWNKELLQHPGMKRRTDLCCALKVFLEKKENVMQLNWWTVEEIHGRDLGRGSVNGRVHQFWH